MASAETPAAPAPAAATPATSAAAATAVPQTQVPPDLQPEAAGTFTTAFGELDQLAASVPPGVTAEQHAKRATAVVRDTVSTLRQGQALNAKQRAMLDDPYLASELAAIEQQTQGASPEAARAAAERARRALDVMAQALAEKSGQ